MPNKWTEQEKDEHYSLLEYLYIKENKTISEIGVLLGVSEKTIFKRLKTLSIKTNKKGKLNYANQRNDIKFPKNKSVLLAECFGILLGDGNITTFQVKVTLDKSEKLYAQYIINLFRNVFSAPPKITVRKNGHYDIYLNSVRLSKRLQSEGLVFNKVRSQVDVPKWIFQNKLYMKAFLRGFFDTDGSIYKIKFGIQMSFTNKSVPLLKALQKMLNELQYKPSEISSWKIYLTRKEDIERFFFEIESKNQKHIKRFHKLNI